MGAGTPGKGGFGPITPGGDGPGVRPPKPGDPGPGVRPPKGEGGPKVTPAPLPSDTKYIEDKPSGEKAGPGLFGKLLEGIKKTDKFKRKIKEGGKGIGPESMGGSGNVASPVIGEAFTKFAVGKRLRTKWKVC